MPADLLDDWRISLRARGRSLATIASYLTVGQAFAAYLAECGTRVDIGRVRREDV